MDARQFDELVAKLTSAPSRRETLKGIVGGALAAVGVTAVAESKKKKHRGKGGAGAEKKPKGKGDDVDAELNCIPTGAECPQFGKKRKKRRRRRRRRGNSGLTSMNRVVKKTCNDCCQHTSTTADGKTFCACKQNGEACTQATRTDCCSLTCGTTGANLNKCVAYGTT